MFCYKCGKEIPDESVICPECGADLSAHLRDEKDGLDNCDVSLNQSEDKVLKEKTVIPYILVIMATICSFVFLALNYMTVDVQVLGLSASNSFTGYGFTGTLGGSGRITGLMVILLIIINIVLILTCALALLGRIEKEKIHKILKLGVSGYAISTIVSFIHITSLLGNFEDTIGEAKIGPGCYLHLGVAFFMVIMYFLVFRKELKE